MLFMLQFENIRKLLEAAVRPKLREPFYTTTVCVNLVFAAFRVPLEAHVYFARNDVAPVEDIRVRTQRGRVPIADVVVKRSSGMKHILHTRHLGRVPTPNRLVERSSGTKHILHTRHLGRVPTPNRLVERSGGTKHIIHTRHLGRVPTPNRLVERSGGLKHILHTRYTRCIPFRNVAVKGRFSIKHSAIAGIAGAGRGTIEELLVVHPFIFVTKLVSQFGMVPIFLADPNFVHKPSTGASAKQ